MKKIIFTVMYASTWLLFAPVCGMAQEYSPFGVCLHLDGYEEYSQMPQNLRMAQEAGIRWIRCDFSWGSVEGTQGNWNFDRWDRVVEEAEKLGLNLFVPLLYDMPWARPAYKHLDAWLTYVEKVVTRYKGKVRCWEIWNEPDLYPRFWDRYEDGENYALLLKATYQKIKEIDPGSTVVHAGTAGIPMSYIEKSFAAGSGSYFDKMAVHPYRPLLNTWEATLRFKDDIDRLRALMSKYKIDHKDIWFTEMGVSSMTSVAVRGRNVFHEAKAETGKDWKVAVVCDDEFTVDPSFTGQTLRSLFPSGFTLDTIQALDMRHISMGSYDAVFFPPSDNIPMHVNQILMPRLKNYLIGGGRVYYHTKGGNIYYYGDVVKKEANQAIFIAQTIWLSLRFGIERYFCYEFESPEEVFFDREDNFGITRRGLRPKQAYYAYAAAGKLFPEGSKMDTSVEWRQKDCCVTCWRQPNGTRVWAVWSPEGARQVNVKIGRGLKQTLNYLGNPLPAVTESSKTVEIGAGIVYFVGPETLEIQ